MNWDNFKCRCSGINKIMANSRSNPQLTEKQAAKLAFYRLKIEQGNILSETQAIEYTGFLEKEKNGEKVVLGDTCIEYLSEVYALEEFGMVSILKEMSEITQMEKGKVAEDECITLLSIVEGKIYSKNEEIVENDYLRGTPDVFNGKEIMRSDEIIDIKSSFDMPGFIKKINVEVTNGWRQQLQGYCDITGAKIARISNCLVSMPEKMQEEFFNKLRNKMKHSGDYISEDSPSFIRDLERIWSVLQRSMNVNHVPKHQRVFNVDIVPFTEFERKAVYDRVKVCREWLNNFHEQYQQLNVSLVQNDSL